MRYTFQEPHMGTLFNIILYAPDQASAQKAVKDAFARVEQLNDILSDYKADSELMRLCKQAGGPPVPVSEDLFKVLEASQEIAKLSDGAFDVSISPVVRLWRKRGAPVSCRAPTKSKGRSTSWIIAKFD